MDLQILRRIKENAGTGLLIVAALIGLYLFYPLIETLVTVAAIAAVGYFAYIERDKIRDKYQQYFGDDA